jgi:hypothetical protein
MFGGAAYHTSVGMGGNCVPYCRSDLNADKENSREGLSFTQIAQHAKKMPCKEVLFSELQQWAYHDLFIYSSVMDIWIL